MCSSDLKFGAVFGRGKFLGKIPTRGSQAVFFQVFDGRPLDGSIFGPEILFRRFFPDVKICNQYNIETCCIDLEITESATIDSNINILKVLNNIKEKGFIISIDDFGTGYSSLNMLQNMPIDIIKIDKVFIDKADLSSHNNIINYIMLIAKHLGVKTIAEGVETKEQMEFIRDIKCDIIQGYYYSKPIAKEEFENYFNKNK